MSTSLPHLTDEAALERALADDTPLLIDFSADWCPPCRRLEPLLVTLQARHGAHLRIVEIDASRQAALASRYNVKALPTLLLFHRGTLRERQVGLPSAARLEAMVSAVLATG